MRRQLRTLTSALAARWRHRRWRAFTMLPAKRYRGTFTLMDAVWRTGIPDGAIVECGTWRGGMSAGLIEYFGPDRPYHFFDSYEGLPEADAIDGEDAKRGSAKIKHNNNTASLDEFRSTIDRVKASPTRIEIHKGWVETTVPDAIRRHADLGQIALLRLDLDFYSGTKTGLDAFFDRVVPGGLILIDDYADWQGCAIALHEFLAARRRTEIIREWAGGVFYLRKS